MFHRIKKHDSLAKRIFLLAFTTISFSVLLTGGVIAWSFDKSQERVISTYLTAYIDTLIAVTAIDTNGNVTVSDSIAVYNNMPFYWQVTYAGRNIRKSDTLPDWLHEADFTNGEIHNIIINQQGSLISFTKRTLKFPGNIEVYYIFGIPADIILALFIEEKQKFTFVLLATLAIFTFLLITVIALMQIRAITKPLEKIKSEIVLIHEGKKQNIENCFPKEIALLCNEINKLINYNIAIIERYGTFAANLSHSLKTPLTVIGNASQKATGEIVGIVREQSSEMFGIIERNLARVAASGKSVNIYSNINVNELIRRIINSFGKLYSRKIDLNSEGTEIFFKGNEADLYEIFGNIIENSCKYSRSLIRVVVQAPDKELVIIIEDDGPGIAENEIDNVLKYGTRLDTTKPGHGVGLAVAEDIIRLYSGKISFGRSDIGGLMVRITLPMNFQ